MANPGVQYLLQEDGSFLLQEDGSKIILEQSETSLLKTAKNENLRPRPFAPGIAR